MSRTYNTEGINLKAMPLGESDRLLTILTPDHGLVRAIAPGARKHNSRLAGRSSLFVVNNLMLAQGKNLDRIAQADTLYSFPGLAKDLGKLTAGQYLAEIVLGQNLSDQSQGDLYHLLRGHLERIETAPAEAVLAHLTQAIFHLISLAGLTPQVYQCCVSRAPIQPNFTDPRWRISFSITAGGLIQSPNPTDTTLLPSPTSPPLKSSRLNALETALLQCLAESSLPDLGSILEKAGVSLENTQHFGSPWPRIEQVLRQYVEYHLDRTIRSARLLDSYRASVASPLPSHS